METSPHHPPPASVPGVSFRTQQDCAEYGSNGFPHSGFWTSTRRQYVIMAVVNLVTFLQGASLSTASITVPRLSADENFALNDTTWPKDFVVTEEEGDWICKRILQIRTCDSLIPLLFAARTWVLSHLVSALVANSVAEIIGRKKSMIVDCAAFLLGYAIFAIGQNVASLCVARAFMGYPLINTVR